MLNNNKNTAGQRDVKNKHNEYKCSLSSYIHFFLENIFYFCYIKKKFEKNKKNKFIDKLRIRFVNNIKKMFSKFYF